MKKFYVIVALLCVFAFTSVVPAYAKIKKHENPLHERRKKLYEKNKEVYKGIKVDEDEAEKKKESEEKREGEGRGGKKSDKDRGADKEGKKKDPRLEELMKEFDQDSDGIISYKEMEAAKAEGKDEELKALLEEDKPKDTKKKSKEKKSKASRGGKRYETYRKEDGSKEVILAPQSD